MKDNKIIVISPNSNKLEVVEIDPDKDLGNQLRAIIDGWLEDIGNCGLRGSYTVLVDEDGQSKGCEVNVAATQFYEGYLDIKYGRELPIAHDPIVGKMVIVKVLNLEDGPDHGPLADNEILAVKSRILDMICIYGVKENGKDKNI